MLRYLSIYCVSLAYLVLVHVFNTIYIYMYNLYVYIWQTRFELRDYRKAESDICMVGDTIATTKNDTFPPAP